MSHLSAARSRGIVVLAAAAVVVGGAAVPANAASVTLRSGDLIGAPLDDTRATGHKEFLRNGLHLWTEGTTSTDKVTAYFPVDATFPTSASMDYVSSYGDTLRPGMQLVFDVDQVTGNGNDYNVLVGEPTYADGTVLYGNQWWLTNGSSADAKAVAPHVGGGYGSLNYGTLAEWAAAFSTERALAGGVSLGSGVKGDGILKSLRYGTTVYEFTNQAVSTNGTQRHERHERHERHQRHERHERAGEGRRRQRLLLLRQGQPWRQGHPRHRPRRSR